MRKLFRKYKPVIRFVLLFMGAYLVLSFLYAMYLSYSKDGSHPPDFVTNLVAKQSSSVINSLNYNAEVIPHASQPTMKLMVENSYVANIIEGCNAVSIIILFVAFIIAFAQNFKKTLLFLLAGITLIYAVNILRIVVLAIALYHYPEQEANLHGIVFPGLIYGMVFLLWIVWVRAIKVSTR